MIGAIQWAVSLGKLDFNTTVMTLESFRAEPMKVHRDLCNIVLSYLAKLKCATISIRTKEPALSSMSSTLCDCEE